MPLTTSRLTIAAGQALSAPIDCSTGTVLAVTVPYNWTRANISFQVSSDGVDYYDVVDENGREVLLTAMAGTCLTLGAESYWKGMHIKIRSGSKDNPVAQVNAVEFTVPIQT